MATTQKGEPVRLDQICALLPWAIQTIYNWRRSGDPRASFTFQRDGRKHLYAHVDDLLTNLLSEGMREVACDVLLRVDEVKQFGNVFGKAKLECRHGSVPYKCVICTRTRRHVYERLLKAEHEAVKDATVPNWLISSPAARPSSTKTERKSLPSLT